MNQRVDRISGSLIREIAAKRRTSSIDLGLGEPSLAPNAAHLEAAMRYVRAHGLRYTVNAGDPHLREAIASHYGYPRLSNVENVCVTTGSQEATFAVIKTLLDPSRDELLVVEPAFPSYAKMATLEGVRVRRVAMTQADDFAFDAQRIIGAVTPATRLIAICSPCNPTGRAIHREAVEALSAALERLPHPVWVLHDEIYREQTYIDGAGYFASRYPRTVVTNSVSKSNALTGLRLGWALVPREIAPSLVKVHAWITSCADTFAQQVALDIFTSNGLREHATWYSERCAQVNEALQRSGLRYIVPEGSFYACVHLGDGVDSLAAAHRLADECNVIAIPGVAFGECFAQWLRLTWVCPLEQFCEGLRRITQFALLFGSGGGDGG